MDEHRPIFKLAITRRLRSGDAASRLGKYHRHYFGRWKPAGRGWTWKKLFADKAASETAWRQFQKEQEQVAASGVDEKSARIARKSLAELVDLYLLDLEAQRRSPEHIEGTGRLLKRLLNGTGWRLYRDIRVADVQLFLNRPEHAKWTVEYQTDWIKVARAFGRWLCPEGQRHPLADLRRPSRKNAVRTKARRVASPAEVQAMLSDSLPPHRRLAYALAVLNGLRRGEATKLTWSDVLFDASPSQLRLTPKDSDAQREFDCVPLHPFVEQLLRAARGDAPPTARVLTAVPDAKTVRKDLERAGFSYKDDRGRLLCYHALRHTYKHNLEGARTPYTPLRQLMRHVARSVTDTYGASDMQEMYGYLKRLDPWLAPDCVSTASTPPPSTSPTSAVPPTTPDATLAEPASRPEHAASAPGTNDRVIIDVGATADPLDALRRLVDSLGGAEALVREIKLLMGLNEGGEPLTRDGPEPPPEPVGPDAAADDLSPYLSHAVAPKGLSVSSAGQKDDRLGALMKLLQLVVEPAICRWLALSDLKGHEAPTTVQNSRPDTQAD